MEYLLEEPQSQTTDHKRHGGQQEELWAGKVTITQLTNDKTNANNSRQTVYITKTLLFKYKKKSPPKTENFQIKKKTLIFFIFLLKT